MEIKFRAYGQLPHMSEPKMIYDWQDSIDIESYCFNNEYVTLMQFTGLKDKSNNEIYQGDIVKIRAWGKEYIGIVKFGNHHLYCEGGYVSVDAFGFYVADPDDDDDFIAPDDELTMFNEMEVIGNIYENPELLRM